MQMKELVVAGVYTLLWMCASSGLILLNKYILSNLDFHYPLALSRCGPAAAAGLGRDERPRHLTRAFLRRRQPRPGLLVAGVYSAHPRAEDAQAGNQGRDPRVLPLPHLSARLPHGTRAGPRARLSAQPPWQSVICVLTWHGTQAATLGFGNLAYLYLSVSFIQILKAATPVMTMVILVAVRLDKLSTPVRRCRRCARCTTLTRPAGHYRGVHHRLRDRHLVVGRAGVLHAGLHHHDLVRCAPGSAPAASRRGTALILCPHRRVLRGLQAGSDAVSAGEHEAAADGGHLLLYARWLHLDAHLHRAHGVGPHARQRRAGYRAGQPHGVLAGRHAGVFCQPAVVRSDPDHIVAHVQGALACQPRAPPCCDSRVFRITCRCWGS